MPKIGQAYLFVGLLDLENNDLSNKDTHTSTLSDCKYIKCVMDP